MDLPATLGERILSFAASCYGRKLAEDVAQELMLVLHQKYSRVSDAAQLLPLALQIVRFTLNA